MSWPAWLFRVVPYLGRRRAGDDLEQGRGFRAGDTAVGGPGVAILTHDLWQGAFGGDAGIVGRVLTLDDQRVEVIGVLPESLWLPDLELLTPLRVGTGGPPEILAAPLHAGAGATVRRVRLSGARASVAGG